MSEEKAPPGKRGPRAARPHMPGYGIKPSNEGEGLLPWSWAVERLVASHGYWVSTVRPDGAPHCMPVWGIWINDRFLFSTGAQSRKARNLANNPKCVVCTEHVTQAVIVEGIVEMSTEPSVTAEFCRAYGKKYHWGTAGFSEPVFVVRPVVAFAVTETSGEYSFTGSATRWTFDTT